MGVENKGSATEPYAGMDQAIVKKLWKYRLLVISGAIMAIVGPFVLRISCYTSGLPDEMMADWTVESPITASGGAAILFLVMFLLPGILILLLSHLDRRRLGSGISMATIAVSMVALIFPIYLAWWASTLEEGPEMFQVYYEFWSYHTPGGTWSESSMSLYLGGIIMSIGGAMALLGTFFRMRILKNANASDSISSRETND